MKLNDFAPDIPDAMQLWALRPYAILVKVISVFGLNVFFHQYLADLRERESENVLRTVSASPHIFDLTVRSTSGVIATPPEVHVRNILPLATVVNIMHAVITGMPFVVPPAPGIERPVMQAREFLTCRPLKSRESLHCSVSRPPRPRPRCRETRPSIRRLRFHSTVFSLYEGTHLLRQVRPCCRRRQMTVWFRVWMIQTLPCGVSCFRGQNPLVLCLHVRQSGLCYRPDPPVFPTGSVIRISTTLPEGSSTSAMPVNPGEDGSLQSGLPNRPYKYSESGDLLCTGENLAFGLLPHPIQDLVIARCLELLRLQFRRAVHVRTMNAVPEGLVYHGVIV